MQTGLNHLFNKSYFDICALDSILSVVQSSRATEAYKLLRVLHCVDYASMPKALRDSLPELVNEALNPPEVVCIAVDVAMRGL